jgi:hypothetical protein
MRTTLVRRRLWVPYADRPSPTASTHSPTRRAYWRVLRCLIFVYPAWEDVVLGGAATPAEPGEQAVAGLLRQLELDRLPRFLLDDGRAVAGGGVHDQIGDPQPDQVAAAELAVDGQVEQGQVAEPPLPLQVEADGPDLLGPEGRLGTDEAALVPRHDGPRMGERDARLLALHSTSPEPRGCGSGDTVLALVWTAGSGMATFGHFKGGSSRWHSGGSAAYDPFWPRPANG